MVDELECFVSNEHLLHLLGESGHDRVAIAIHRESFLDGELRRLALREEEVGLVVPDCSAAERANRAGSCECEEVG